jgi:hypothetical protein
VRETPLRFPSFSRSNLKTGAKPKSVAVTLLAETNRRIMGARIAFI